MRRRLNPLILVIGATLISALTKVGFASNGAAPIALNAKAAGRGGAETAVADNALSQAVNPATATEIPWSRADGMLGWLITRSRFQNDFNDRLRTSYDTVLGGAAVLWAPGGGDEGSDSPWRLGFSVFVPVGGGGEAEIVTPVFPEGETEATTFFFLNLMPSFAWRIHPRLSIGAGLNAVLLQLETEGLVGTNDNSSGLVFRYWNPDDTPISPPQPFDIGGKQVTWAEVFDLAGTEDANESSRVELTDGSGFGIGATIGLLWSPTDALHIGLSYRTPGFVGKAKGKAVVDADRSIADLNSDPQLAALLGGVIETYLPRRGQDGFKGRYDFEIDRFDQPAVLQAGMSLRLRDTWMVALDLRYIFWSDAFGEKDVLLSGGTNEDINAINGSDEIRDKKLLRWKNQFVIGLGTAFAIPSWSDRVVFRLGYNYGKNPQPADTFTANSGIVEHHFSAGASYLIGDWDLDFAYVYAFPKELDVKAGQSKAANAYNDSATRAEQHFLYFGLGYRF